MSLTASDLRIARDEALASGRDPADILEALCVINRRIVSMEAEERNKAWACGRRGDAAAKIPGLTDTLTDLVRRFAACGVVRHDEVADLHRHKSALSKVLKVKAPSVIIETLVGEGYEIVAGFDELYRLLHQSKKLSRCAPGFTARQTEILHVLAARGSIHTDWGKAVQRHMSNIRAELKRQGLSKKITITTHGGEGLYTVDKGREVLSALVEGEAVMKALPATPKTKRVAQQKPPLALVAA